MPTLRSGTSRYFFRFEWCVVAFRPTAEEALLQPQRRNRRPAEGGIARAGYSSSAGSGKD